MQHPLTAAWNFLKPHDLVDIIAPASRCNSDILPQVRDFLRNWELETRIPNDIFGESFLFANSDAMRLQQLVAALTNLETKMVWCLLGGYGSMRLIPELAKIEPPKQMKLFIGSSDITALHLFLQQHWGWATVHGPSVRLAGMQKVSVESLNMINNIIFKKSSTLILPKISPLNKLAERPGIITAQITGGNLSLISASLATGWQIDARGKIILIEEINERGYRIDRALEQLRQAGIFEQAQAILFGDLIGGEEADGTSTVMDVINYFTAACPIPVLRLRDVGHGFVNDPVLLGYPAELRLGAECSLRFEL